MPYPSTLPTHSPVLVTPAGDCTATCSHRPGGEAPTAVQSPDCGTFAEWELRALPAPAADVTDVQAADEPDLLSCNRHLAAAVEYLSELQDRRADQSGARR
jgi:hypothetical protein